MTVYSGNFTAPGTSAEVRLELEVTLSSQSIPLNTSVLAWTLRMVEHVNGSPFRAYHDCVAAAAVNGSVYGASTLDYDFNLSNETIIIASGTRDVVHDSNGTKTISISASYDGKSPLGTASLADSIVLPTIPRASTPTYSDSTPDAGDAITITTNRADATFLHDLGYRWQSAGGSYTSIATGVGASTGWTVPSSLLNDIPNTTSRVLEILTTTKTAGGTTIGTSTTTITVGVAASVVPNFGTVTHAEAVTSPNVSSLIGAYVQAVSKLTLAITSAVAGTGATVTSKVVQVRNAGGTVLQTVDVTSGSAATPAALSASGTLTLRGTVTDSRGRSYYEDVTITVLAYTLPRVTAIDLSRSLSDGTLDDNGTYIRVDLNAAVQSLLVSAVQKNALTYKISTSPADAGSWTVKATTTPGGVTFNSHAEVGTYVITDSFDVKVEVYDKLSSAAPLVILGTVSTGGVFLHLGNSGEGIGVGKYWEAGSVDALERMYQRGGLEVVDETDLADALATMSRRNLIANAMFRVNQRGALTGTSLAAGEYFLDRWQSVSSSNAVTWVSHGSGDRVLTIPSGKTIKQIIERLDMIGGGTVTLSWQGTATGRVYDTGATPPSYAASGATFVVTGAGNVEVDLTAGTVYGVQLEFGSVATALEWNSYPESLARCQRYYRRLGPSSGSVDVISVAAYYSTVLAYGVVRFPVSMRAAPTCSASAQTIITALSNGSSQTSTAIAFSNVTTDGCRVDVTTAARTAGDAAWLTFIDNARYLEFNAEL